MVKQCAIGKDAATLAPLASPTFTGAPAAVTAAVGTNTTQIATTAFTLANAHTFVKLSASDTLRSSRDDPVSYTYSYGAQDRILAATFLLPPNITIGSVVRIKVNIKGAGTSTVIIHVGADAGNICNLSSPILGVSMGRDLGTLSGAYLNYTTVTGDFTCDNANSISLFLHPSYGNPSGSTGYVQNMRLYATAGVVTAPGWT